MRAKPKKVAPKFKAPKKSPAAARARAVVPSKPHGETSGRGFAPAVQPGGPKRMGIKEGLRPGVRARGRAGAPGQLKKIGQVKPGFDPGKFASEVSSNFSKGVAAVGRSLDVSPGVGASRAASRGVPSGAQSKKNNSALKKALGRN